MTRLLTLLLLLFLALSQPIPAPADPPPAAPMAVPQAISSSAIAAVSDHGRGSPLDRWKLIAMEACERHGCDGRLLIAIGLAEIGTDPRGPQTPHDDMKSYGRYGVLPRTVAFHRMGKQYSRMKNLFASDIIEIIRLLSNEETGADISAEHLRWCTDRPYVKRSRNPRASAAHCWNPNDSAYPGKVMAEYKKLKEGA